MQPLAHDTVIEHSFLLYTICSFDAEVAASLS